MQNVIIMFNIFDLLWGAQHLPQIESLAYENAVLNFPDTVLHFGYFMKVVLGTFKDYYAIVTALSSGNEIEIN